MQKKIKLFFFDVDGTMTDGKINISENGELFKSFYVKDGLGLKKLIPNGIIPIIITGRYSKIVEFRCAELGINTIYQNVSNKKELVESLLKEYNADFESAAYIGDDENDLEAMKICGLSFAPADAIDIVKDNSKYVLKLNGGCGCVREAIEIVLSNNKNLGEK